MCSALLLTTMNAHAAEGCDKLPVTLHDVSIEQAGTADTQAIDGVLWRRWSHLSTQRLSNEPQPENNRLNTMDNNLNTHWSSPDIGSTLDLDFGDVKELCSVNTAWYNDGVDRLD